MAIIFYAFYTTLQIKCPHEYKYAKDKEIINREILISKIWAFRRSLNTTMHLFNKETEKVGHFSA